MKVSLGFVLLVLGIMGIARGGVDSPQNSLGEMIGTGPGFASLVTLAAAFLLVGGLLILAKTGRFFEGAAGPGETVACNLTPPLKVADAPVENEST